MNPTKWNMHGARRKKPNRVTWWSHCNPLGKVGGGGVINMVVRHVGCGEGTKHKSERGCKDMWWCCVTELWWNCGGVVKYQLLRELIVVCSVILLRLVYWVFWFFFVFGEKKSRFVVLTRKGHFALLYWIDVLCSGCNIIRKIVL